MGPKSQKKSRYQREEINRHTNQHEYHASCTEAPAKEIFVAHRRISSGQRVHETEKYTNKPQIMKVCPKCNEKIKEAYFAAHLYQHLKNIDKNDRVIYTCRICEIEFFSRSSKDAHRKEKHFDLERNKNIFTTSKVYFDEEKDEDVPLEEEMPNPNDCQESDYVVQYECQKCNEMFTSEYSKKMHRNKKHPQFEGRLFSKKAVPIENESVPQNNPLKNDGSVSRKSLNNMHGQAKATSPSRPTKPGILKKCSESITKQSNVESESMKTTSRPSFLEYDLDYMCEICKKVFPRNERKMHRRKHPEIEKFKKLFVKIDFPNLERGKKANAEHVTPQKRKSNDHCNIAAPAKVQRRRMTCQERRHISDESFNIVKPAKIQKRRSTLQKRALETEKKTSAKVQRRRMTCQERPHNSDDSYNNVKPAKIQKRRSTITKKSSINREENIVKKVTLFECGICKIHFIKSSNIKWHILKGHPLEESWKCQNCGYYFSTDFSFHDEAHHEKSKLSREDFSVLAFDENQFRKKLNAFLAESDEEEISEENSYKEKSTPVESDLRSRLNKTTSKTLENPGVEGDVSEKEMNSQSEKLDIFCYSNNDVKSVLVPMSLLTNMNIEKSGKDVDLNTIKSKILYKCKFCDINYTMEKTMICDQCNLKFSTESLKDQNNDAHHNDSSVEKHNFVIIEHPLNDSVANVKILYKCKFCDINYTMEKTMICDQCNLEFSTESLKDQNNDAHHNDSSVEKHNFVIIEHPQNDIVANANVIQNEDEHRTIGEMVERNEINTDQVITLLEKNKRKSHIKLYKCFSCEVHFTQISTCKTHIHRHNFFFNFEYTECICGLKFEQAELTEHMKIHHAHSFNLDDVEIIEVHSFAPDSTQYVPTEDTVNNAMSSNSDNTSKKGTGNKEVNAEVNSLRQEEQNEIDDINEKGSRCVSVLTPSAAEVHVPNINENIMVNTPRIPQRRGRRILSC